jgi:hypothetical protein
MISDNLIIYDFLRMLINVMNSKEVILNNPTIIELIKPLKKSIKRIHPDLDNNELIIFSVTSLFMMMNSIMSINTNEHNQKKHNFSVFLKSYDLNKNTSDNYISMNTNDINLFSQGDFVIYDDNNINKIIL